MFDEPGAEKGNREVVILDDNSTTGLTLQMARDYLVSMNYDVVGIVLVRFPVANRYVHMMIDMRALIPKYCSISFAGWRGHRPTRDYCTREM